MIITDQDRSFKIVPQYSNIRELAPDSNRTSLPTPKSAIQTAINQATQLRADEAWIKFFEDGGTL